jgi:hypothetical protein
MPDLEALAADTTPWTLRDIMRELEISAQAARNLAWRAQVEEANTALALPAALPGSPWLAYVELHRVTLGRWDGAEPTWAAGEVRQWARQCARVDHEFKPIKQRPLPPRRRANWG